MTNNPYAPPSAVVRDSRDASEPIRLYSPVQVACGTIGGPVGLIYFLKANFHALGNHDAERNTLIAGAALIVALVASLPLLPENFPSAPFTIGYIVAALHVTGKYQMSKKAITESPRHVFHSNWRVLGIGLLCLVASGILVAGPLAALVYFGIWNP